MKIKTRDLTRRALDWAVAKADGRLGATIRDETRPGTSIIDIDFDEFGELVAYMPGRRGDPYIPYTPSTDWSQGGPIIDRELLQVAPHFHSAGYKHPKGQWYWVAHVLGPNNMDENHEQHGPTALIAAMRCYVASKLGDEVDIPNELGAERREEN